MNFDDFVILNLPVSFDLFDCVLDFFLAESSFFYAVFVSHSLAVGLNLLLLGQLDICVYHDDLGVDHLLLFLGLLDFLAECSQSPFQVSYLLIYSVPQESV